MMRNWFIPIAISVSVSAHAAPPPQAEITYSVSRNGTVLAEVVEKLKQDGKTYSIEENTKGVGILSVYHSERSSRGTIAPDGLRPLEYTDHRPMRDPASANFDWSNKTITMNFKGPPRVLAMPPNAQDRLSVAFTFSFAPPGSRPVTVHSADGKSISTYTYRAAGHERLATPAGVFETLKLEKVRDGPEDKSTELWLATDHGNLPVRLLIVDKDGTRLDQVATQLNIP
ncbi:MAG TPA: DUF3108 domain-containing protein [Burkholderiales bacterium]|nr:DUF3108 domain-containing protein [Burkholderiales bacterium]